MTSQRRLGVERIEMRRSAMHEEKNDSLRPGRGSASFSERGDRAPLRRPAALAGPAARSRKPSAAAAHGATPADRRTIPQAVSLDVDEIVRSEQDLAVALPGSQGRLTVVVGRLIGQAMLFRMARALQSSQSPSRLHCFGTRRHRRGPRQSRLRSAPWPAPSTRRYGRAAHPACGARRVRGEPSPSPRARRTRCSS